MYRRVTEEEVEDNKDRLTAAWQPHHGFEAVVAHTETCRVCGHGVKQIIPNEDLITALLCVVKQTGSNQNRHNRWELLPKDRRTKWINTKIWWEKTYLRVKPSMLAVQPVYDMNVAEEAANCVQYNASVAQLITGHLLA
jgi:hypothetical protein